MSFPVHYTYMYIGSVQNKQNIEDTASNLKLNSDGISIPSLLVILIPRDKYDSVFFIPIPRDVLVIPSHLIRFKVTKGSEGSGRSGLVWSVPRVRPRDRPRKCLTVHTLDHSIT